MMSSSYNALEHVPYDVWRHITSFLPLVEVEQLYTLNRSLFNIAMDERYKAAGFGLLFQRQTLRTLSRLVEPDIARRVRTFTFRPGHLCNLLQQEHGKWPHRRVANNVANNVLDRSHRPEVDRIQALKPKTIQQIVLNIMKNLMSLTCLNIEIPSTDHIPFSQTTPSFFVQGWQAFGRNLTTLKLIVPLEDLHLVLPTGLTVTGLRTLCVQVFHALHNDLDETVIMRKTLLPFISSHKTITSLAVEAPEGINLSFLLQHLILMPSLRIFGLNQSFESLLEADLSGLHQFLDAHQTRIRDLSIKITAPFCPHYPHYPDLDTFFAQKCFRVPLPVIERLTLFYFPVYYTTGFASYIGQFKSTLTSLTIKGQSFDDNELSSLVTHLAAPGILRELDISIISLKPRVFRLLSVNLPNLEVLTLNFMSVASYIYDGDLQISFVLAMHQTSIQHWKLHTLNITHVDTRSLPQRTAVTAILAALPNVQTFSGLNRAQYLDK